MRYGRGLTNEGLEEATAQDPTLSGEDICLALRLSITLNLIADVVCRCLKSGATRPTKPVPYRLQLVPTRASAVKSRALIECCDLQ